MTKVYLKDGIYIPMKFVKPEHMEAVEKRFQRHVYFKEKVCEGCEFFAERPSDMCTGCPNYGGLYKLHSEKTFKGKECLRLPYGDRKSVKKIFGDDLDVVDLTPDIDMRREFKMTARPYDYQVPAIAKMLKVRSGVLKSAPRTGKTVMAANYISHMGKKTLILASQTDWLDNFMETFVGSKSQPAMTDINPKRIGFAKKLEEFQRYDICLSTYQTFLSPKGKKLLKKIRSMFTILILDEVQFTAALEFSRIIGQLNCRYKFGLSGTPERKDTLEYVVYKLFGNVFYETSVPRLKPRVEVVKMPPIKKLPNSWTYAVGALEKSPERLRVIMREAIKDAKAGHVVMIPLARVPVIKALTQAINIEAGSDIAVAFHGGTSKGRKRDGGVEKGSRKWIVDTLRKAKRLRVVVGTMRLLSTGLNIPAASMLYQVTPSSNLPKAEQRFSRVLTPMEGKLTPVFKYFLDDAQIVRSCMRAEHFGCVYPVFKPMMTPQVRLELDAYFRGKKVDQKAEGFGGYL